MREGQLYTARDLTFSAWEEREKVRKAITEATEDPFVKLNLNPLHEYKVPYSRKKLIRILPFYRTLYRVWDGFSLLQKQVVQQKIKGN
jgi:hypothetical protein